MFSVLRNKMKKGKTLLKTGFLKYRALLGFARKTKDRGQDGRGEKREGKRVFWNHFYELLYF